LQNNFVDNDINALPVVDEAGRVVGIISEADLMRREELSSEKIRPWWLEAMTPAVRLLRNLPVARLAEQLWRTDFGERNIIVVNGVANL
jgi:CBS domain-containing protein